MEPPPLSSRRALFLWTKRILVEHGIRPREQLSQSFVVDPRLVRAIVSYVKKLYCRDVIEVGSGLGTITSHLLKLPLRVLAVEIDGRLAYLARKVVGGGCTIVHGDALPLEWRMECLVSNVPYHITSDLMVKLVRSNSVKRAVLVVQKEVASRILARPGTRDYGRLGILVGLVFDVEPGPMFSPQSFYPKPRVCSRILVLRRKMSYNRVLEVLEEVTRRVFSERRKKAVSVFEKKLGLGRRELEELGIAGDMRVYEVEPWVLVRVAERIVERGSM